MTGTDNKGAQGGPSQKHHMSGRSLHWNKVYKKGVSTQTNHNFFTAGNNQHNIHVTSFKGAFEGWGF